MSTMFVKVCGITNLDDALSAVEAGADALGFNFYRPSPRFITPESARSIIERVPAKTLSVGVFVNEARPDIVAQMADEAGVRAIQLHGDETPEFCRALGGRYVIKALRAGAGFEPERASEYEADAILLDAFSDQGFGGMGRAVDWSLARRVRERVPRLILAGGLTPENVAEAIRQARPYGVDACSGLERAPGLKSAALMRSFLLAARAGALNA